MSQQLNNCNKCDGRCKEFGVTKKDYYHFIIKFNINEQESRKNIKPKCCDFCKKITDTKFLNEPFCSEILEIYCPFWFCNDCYNESKMNI